MYRQNGKYPNIRWSAKCAVIEDGQIFNLTLHLMIWKDVLATQILGSCGYTIKITNRCYHLLSTNSLLSERSSISLEYAAPYRRATRNSFSHVQFLYVFSYVALPIFNRHMTGFPLLYALSCWCLPLQMICSEDWWIQRW
jgi:hypothetical protein